MLSGYWRSHLRPPIARLWWWALRVTRPPRRLRFTREGKVFVGITLGVGFAAVNTGNNLLYLVLGLLLSLMILSGVLSEIALRGLEFRRRLPRRAFAGVAALVEIEVHNTKRYAPSYSIEVEDRIEGRRTDKRCYFLKVSPGARQTAAYRRVAPVRGPERFVALRVATRFPFGLFEKWREVDMDEEHVVYPAPHRLPGRARPTVAAGDRVTREERGHGEVDGVRELADGDPARDVHWAKTAAVGRLVARERRREGVKAVQVWVANAPPEVEGLDPAARARAESEFALRVEDDIRRAAARAVEALRAGATLELGADSVGAGLSRRLRLRPTGNAVDRALAWLARLPPAPRVVDEGAQPAVAGTRAAAEAAVGPRVAVA